VEGMGRLPIIIAILALTAATVASDESSDPVREIERGSSLFRIYCADCHGQAGRGDGPMAEVLTVRPADLTRLSREHDGAFPTEEVYSTIDGRDEVPAHRAGKMPVWGIALQELDTDVDQEGQVRERIRQLIEYLKAIQVDSGKK
jgi:hypothetical protein